MLRRVHRPARVLGTHLADDLRGHAEHQRACRRGELLGQDGAGPDDRLRADRVATDKDRRLADKGFKRQVPNETEWAWEFEIPLVLKNPIAIAAKQK